MQSPIRTFSTFLGLREELTYFELKDLISKTSYDLLATALYGSKRHQTLEILLVMPRSIFRELHGSPRNQPPYATADQVALAIKEVAGMANQILNRRNPRKSDDINENSELSFGCSEFRAGFGPIVRKRMYALTGDVASEVTAACFCLALETEKLSEPVGRVVYFGRRPPYEAADQALAQATMMTTNEIDELKSHEGFNSAEKLRHFTRRPFEFFNIDGLEGSEIITEVYERCGNASAVDLIIVDDISPPDTKTSAHALPSYLKKVTRDLNCALIVTLPTEKFNDSVLQGWFSFEAHHYFKMKAKGPKTNQTSEEPKTIMMNPRFDIPRIRSEE